MTMFFSHTRVHNVLDESGAVQLFLPFERASVQELTPVNCKH